MRSRTPAVAALAAIALSAGLAQASTYTPGDLVVSQIGDGSAALSSAATTVILQEYSFGSSSLINPLTLNSGASGTRLTNSGSATSEGQISLSADGRYIGIGGYDALAGTASIAGSSAPRSTNLVDMNQNVIAGSYTDAYSANNIRGVVSADGSQVWMSGANQGIRYGTGTSPSTLVSSTSTNNRAIEIVSGSVMFSSGAGTRGIYTLGGEPTNTGNAATLLFATGASSSPYGFYMPNSSTVYVADDSGNATGGIQKWVLNGTVWSQAFIIGTGTTNIGARGLTGTVDGSGNVLLYATTAEGSANRLISVADTLSNTTTAPTTINTLATAGTNTIFRGVALTPVPTPGTMALIGLGAVAAFRRRR